MKEAAGAVPREKQSHRHNVRRKWKGTKSGQARRKWRERKERKLL